MRIWDTTLQEHDDEPGAVLLFVDTGGDDTYYGPMGATRLGTINPVSVAIDLAGKDTYTYRSADHDRFNTTRPGRFKHLGAGHDFSIGVLINEGGNDTHVIAGLGAGASNCNGIGLFIDNAGNDSYQASSDYGSGMGNVRWKRQVATA